GGLLILSGLFQGASLLAAPLIEKYMEAQVEAQKAADDAARKRQIDELRAQEVAAEDEGEKAVFAEKRRLAEAAPRRFRPNMKGTFAISLDPRLMPYQVGLLFTALVMNALMVAAGIGLVRLRAWGRALGTWVAGLNILRATAVCAITLLVIVPISTAQT